MVDCFAGSCSLMTASYFIMLNSVYLSDIVDNMDAGWNVIEWISHWSFSCRTGRKSADHLNLVLAVWNKLGALSISYNYSVPEAGI